MMKRLLFGVGGIVAVLIAFILIRAFNYGGQAPGIQVIELSPPPAIDIDRAAYNLGEAIRYQTVTVARGDPRPGQEGPWLELQAWMKTTYPDFHRVATRETVPGGLTLLYTWAGTDKDMAPLLLMAHQDVVPVNIGTESDWDAPPFAGEIKDGYVYGRGALDDKGSMVGLFEALNALALDGFRPRRTILLMLGHDEEVSGSGAAAGVDLLASRQIVPEMVLDEGFMAVNPSPLTGKPMAFIGVAEKGYLSLNLTVKAAGGHSSTPPRDSATVRIARALVALDDNQMPSNLSEPPVSTLFRAAAPDLPFLTRLALANQWLFGGLVESSISSEPAGNALIRTTTAPTMLTGSAKENVLAQRATAIVNFRIHPNDTEEDVLDHARRLTNNIEGLEITVANSGIRGAGASPVSPLDNLAYGVLSSVAHELTDGAPVVPGLVLGATDSRYANALTDNVYRFMPALMEAEDLRGFHGTNERLTVENVGRLARGYAQIILAMDSAD